MAKNHSNEKNREKIDAQPRRHQRTGEIQAYGTVNQIPSLDLDELARLEMTAQPTPCGFHDPPRFVQEIALASRRAEVLPIASALR